MYSICEHNRTERINKNFIRCKKCGESIPSVILKRNKNPNDYIENSSFMNFDRNFNNVIEEVDEYTNRPIYEYYADSLGINKIIINKAVQFSSNPPRYEVIVNDNKYYLLKNEINKLLNDTKVKKIDV